ncbi:MAG: ribosome maturation factor RimP [Lachnospiraceae bacterium]|nr:ribosome maturation factor RimP [Lachnospiraceae bacterium]
MAAADIEKRTEKLLEPILEANSFEMVDVEYVKEGSDWYLRAYVDKEGGITVDDCELVSRALEKKLDEEDLIKDAYILEVSSPGLTRPLKKERDYERNFGKLVEIHLFKAVDKCKQFTGTLKAWDESSVTLEVDGLDKTFDKNSISLIRQTFEW